MPDGTERLVRVDAGPVTLEGNLGVPPDPRGVVVFAHGSGSSRHSSRNRSVAADLRAAGLATLLFDLLTAGEEAVDVHTAHLRFDIPLLAERVVGVVRWLSEQAETAGLPAGVFGASTGGARRWWRRRRRRSGSAPSSAAAGARTWPARRCRRSAPPRS